MTHSSPMAYLPCQSHFCVSQALHKLADPRGVWKLTGSTWSPFVGKRQLPAVVTVRSLFRTTCGVMPRLVQEGPAFFLVFDFRLSTRQLECPVWALLMRFWGCTKLYGFPYQVCVFRGTQSRMQMEKPWGESKDRAVMLEGHIEMECQGENLGFQNPNCGPIYCLTGSDFLT